MDTKALRQKVLDLAIRGKLVPQDPNDEPASILLERIRQQKQQMVKDGKLKAKDIKNDTIIFVGKDNLHYEKFADGSVKCIEDEIPFDLPDGWAWVRLQSISTMSNGTAKRSGLDGTQTAVLRLADLGDNEIFFSDTRNVILTDAEIKKYALSAGDVIFVRVNGSKENVGKSYYFEGKPFPVAYCDHLIRCTPTIVLCGKLLSMFMRCGYVRQLIGERMVSAAGQNTISQPSLGTILLPLPPFTEQNRIIKKLEDADNFVAQISDSKQQLFETIDHTKSKILDLAIRGQLVPQNPTDEPASVLLERIRAEKEELIRQGKIKRDKKESVIFRGEDNSYYEKMADGKLHCIDDQLPFELPDGWEWCNLSMIGTTNIGLTYRPTDIEPGGIMVLRSCNIVNDQVDLSDLVRVKTTIRENQFAQKNDILICARNGSRSLVGKCALIPDLGEPASFGAFMAIYRTEYFEFIVHYLRSSFFRSVFDDSNSTAINQLTQDMLKRAIVPLPPLSEQRRIVEAIDVMLFELNQIEKSLS